MVHMPPSWPRKSSATRPAVPCLLAPTTVQRKIWLRVWRNSSMLPLACCSWKALRKSLVVVRIFWSSCSIWQRLLQAVFQNYWVVWSYIPTVCCMLRNMKVLAYCLSAARALLFPCLNFGNGMTEQVLPKEHVQCYPWTGKLFLRFSCCLFCALLHMLKM